MNSTQTIRAIVLALLSGMVLTAPVVVEYGQLLIIGAVCALTLYEGMRPWVVYGSVALLFAAELVYGGDVGVMLIPYCIAVPLLMLLRRFIALPAWAASDGWRVSDAVRAVGAAWLMSVAVLLLSVVTGDMLFGYAHIAERIRVVMSLRQLAVLGITCAVTVILWRRASIPFRTVIRFGI